MDQLSRMLETHPRAAQATDDVAAVGRALKALVACAHTCTSCADACLGEDGVAELTRCIRLNLDCADICEATARVLSRRTDTDLDLVRGQLESCAVACRACAAECESHADHMEHCRICAESCRACAEACDAMIAAIVRA